MLEICEYQSHPNVQWKTSKYNWVVLFLSQLYLLFIHASKYFLIDHHCKTQTEFSRKRQNFLQGDDM